jgi:hypothetical protein
MIFDLAEAFKNAEVQYVLETKSGSSTLRTFKVGDLLLGRYDEEYEFDGNYYGSYPILRRKQK